MKKIFTLLSALVFLFTSCKTTKDYLAHKNEDKTLFDLVKRIDKKSDDEKAVQALPIVYNNLKELHLNKIELYKTYTDLSRWDKILNEYKTLQNFHNAIVNSSNSFDLVSSVNYEKDIIATKEAAAEEYYQAGLVYYSKENRSDAKKAYSSFKKSNQWVSNYKDSKLKMDSAKEKSIVYVLINPVQDNSYSFNSGWGNNNSYGYNTNNLPQTLVRDLGSDYANLYPAKFYTQWDMQRQNIMPQWVVDLTLRSVDIPRPYIYNYTRNVSEKIQSGTDTAGHVIYQTVYATLHIQRQSFNARAQMEININETDTRKNVLYDSFTDTYNWQQESASYSGDSRALSNRDWELINNRYNMPTRDDVLNELYRGLYPQIRNKISYAVDWQ